MDEDVQFVALSNLMTDVVVNISLEELKSLNLKEGAYNRRHSVDFEKLLLLVNSKNQELIQGGSPANVAFNLSCLGIKSSILGTVGDDDYGNKYVEYVESQKIISGIAVRPGSSGVCYVLISPSGERTLVASIGVSKEFLFNHEKCGTPKVFHTSAYELVSDAKKVIDTIEHLKKSGTVISLDLADSSAIIKSKESLTHLLPKIDILFMTDSEAETLTGHKNPLQSIKELSQICSVCILKLGKEGSIIREKGKNIEHKIPIVPVKVVNTNGAGDSYVSGFLFAYINGKSIEECGHFASEIASKVCGNKEPHL